MISDERLATQVWETFADLNRGLQEWFNGSVPNTDESFARVIESSTSDLSYIFPSGEAAEGPAVWEGMRAAWGTNPELRIGTPQEHVEVLIDDDATVVARVVELQSGARAVQRPRHARRTTLVFRRDTSARYGLRLRHLHECLLPEGEEEGIDWESVG